LDGFALVSVILEVIVVLTFSFYVSKPFLGITGGFELLKSLYSLYWLASVGGVGLSL